MTNFPWAEVAWTGMNNYQITLDHESRWPGSFEWKVTCWKYGHHTNMGWFGSMESAQKWILKQLEKGN